MKYMILNARRVRLANRGVVDAVYPEMVCMYASEDVMEDHDYISTDGHGEIDEKIPALGISFEKVEDYQMLTVQT